MTSMAERKRRKKTFTAPPAFVAGCKRLPEDVHRDFAIARQLSGDDRPKARVQGTRVVNSVYEAVSVIEVQRRVMRGMKTLRVLPDKEASALKVGNGWPPYVQNYMDAYNSADVIIPRFSPTPYDISDYLKALDWTRHLQNPQWKLLWWRSFDLSFGAIGRRIGRSDETVRRQFRDTMIDVWSVANSVQSK